MAFLSRFKCEYCGEEVLSKEAPDRCECENTLELDIYDIPTHPYMSNTEKKERYKVQYRLNGYSWLGGKPCMYMGAFDEYPAR